MCLFPISISPEFIVGVFQRLCDLWWHQHSGANRMCTCGFLHLKFAVLISSMMNISRSIVVVVVQSLSHVWLFSSPLATARQASLSFTISWSLLKFMSIESVMLFNHLILCCPLLLLSSIFPSIRVLSSESALQIRWSKCWSFKLQHQPFQWLFRVDLL